MARVVKTKDLLSEVEGAPNRAQVEKLSDESWIAPAQTLSLREELVPTEVTSISWSKVTVIVGTTATEVVESEGVTEETVGAVAVVVSPASGAPAVTSVVSRGLSSRVCPPQPASRIRPKPRAKA
ncbi:MAG: hypothetical protein A2600_00670 [Candidatus Lambdaproteobacteria bacterium RIFOXYD1_FULL_56_27]|nr:MAG: hypothetical protein A2600_00670 [Candidatus Lambdaproteobacteria bacterium RIFOXYD1_FULL_56_27]